MGAISKLLRSLPVLIVVGFFVLLFVLIAFPGLFSPAEKEYAWQIARNLSGAISVQLISKVVKPK